MMWEKVIYKIKIIKKIESFKKGKKRNPHDDVIFLSCRTRFFFFAHSFRKYGRKTKKKSIASDSINRHSLRQSSADITNKSYASSYSLK